MTYIIDNSGKISAIHDAKWHLCRLIEAIHIDGWDKLECPMCNLDLYERISQRMHTPMIAPCWLGLRVETSDQFVTVGDNISATGWKNYHDKLCQIPI